MKFITTILLSAILGLLGFAFNAWLPWWFVAVGGFIAGVLVPQAAFKNFLAAFIGVFLIWLILIWKMDAANDGIISAKIANILPLGGNSMLLMVISCFLGGLVGGLGALTGSFSRGRRTA